MAHVQIAVGLWRKAGADLGFVDLAALVMLGIAGRAAPVTGGISALVQIRFDNLAQEVGGLDRFGAELLDLEASAELIAPF
jgi:hypothetical protein